MISTIKEYVDKSNVKRELIKIELVELYTNLSNCSYVTDEIFDDLIENSNIYICHSSDNYNQIYGAITLIIERKFIHNGQYVCHIEDVVVSEKVSGKGYGKEMIKYAIEYSKNRGCYKIILNCNDKLKPYYEKFGFVNKNHEMSLYY